MANEKTKMPPASTDEQFKFLISCIRYSNNGKVDFSEVANECNIVSKGAAAKRYERMMKQHGLHQSASSSREIPTSPVAKEPKEPKAAKASPPSKKRKAATLDGTAETRHDDHEFLPPRNIKAEGDAIVKDEPSDTVEPASKPAGIMYENLKTGEEVALPADDPLFNDFLHSNAFEAQNGSAHGGYDGAYDPKEYAGMEAAGDGAMMQESILID